MKKTITLFALLFGLALISEVFAQPNALEDFNEKRLRINRTGMYVLGGWAIANLVSSPIMAARSDGRRKYFYQMNGIWNTVNLGLAGFGLYSALTTDPASFSLSQSLREQGSMEKILLFNAGLDVGYMAAGLYLRQLGENRDSDRLRGFGDGLLLQGGFLMAFDLAMYFIHQGHGVRLLDQVDALAFSPSGFRLLIRL